MSERPRPISFHATAGEGFVLTFQLDGTVTGSTVRFWAARRPSGTPVLSSEASPASAATEVTEADEVAITVADEDTEDLLGTYQYEVELEDSGGGKSKAAWGYLTFSQALA